MIYLASVLLCALSLFGSVANLYIAQAAAGTGLGTNCANAAIYTFFNSAGNWGVGATQIGPGSTVHLCGTFTFSAGTAGAFVFQGSGTAGNPITLVAETGAVLQAPYLGRGLIQASSLSYVTVDGASTGIIRATANGTNLANQQIDCGSELCDGAIVFERVDNGIVKNWIIENMYVNVPPNDESGASYTSFCVVYNGGQNTEVSGITCHDSKWGVVQGAYPGVTNSNNVIKTTTIYNVDHCIFDTTDSTTATQDGVHIFGNICHDFVNWDDADDNNHHDGIHVSPSQVGTNINNVFVYNNYIYGDGGFHCNAFIYLAPGNDPTQTITNAYVFNNLLVNTSVDNTCSNGLIQDFGSQNAVIANNTLVGSGTAAAMFGGNTGIILEETSPYKNVLRNNLISTFHDGTYQAPGNSVPDSNYTVFYNLAEVGFCCTTLADWQAQTGTPDLNSTTADPNLNGSYIPQAGGSGVGTGTNLTSLGITALLSDFNGNPRPAVAAWDIGAFNAATTITGGSRLSGAVTISGKASIR